MGCDVGGSFATDPAHTLLRKTLYLEQPLCCYGNKKYCQECCCLQCQWKVFRPSRYKPNCHQANDHNMTTWIKFRVLHWRLKGLTKGQASELLWQSHLYNRGASQSIQSAANLPKDTIKSLGQWQQKKNSSVLMKQILNLWLGNKA